VVTSRSYEQFCGVARALDLIGERWALLIIRDLVLGPKRFTDLRGGLPGIATNVLTQRLKQLERDGIISRRVLLPPAASTVYELTEYGRELESAMLALGRWGARTLGERQEGRLVRSEWTVLAMKAFHDSEAAQDVSATVGLRFPDSEFSVRIDRGELEIGYGRPQEPDLTVTTDPSTLVGFLAGAPVSPEALAAEGDTDLLARLPSIFALHAGSDPVKAP
jgi:DNA-binding HxlR family transcriptional regulator